MKFVPDYHNMIDVAMNKRPKRLPVYEHFVNTPFMEKVLNTPIVNLEGEKGLGLTEFFRQVCRFYKEQTYDTVSYEWCVGTALIDSGAIMGGRPGPIQTRADFQRYPWEEIPRRFWEKAGPRFDALAESLPTGMKAIGGIGNGVMEIAEDLVGFEYLACMQAEDPDLVADICVRIGDLMVQLWAELLDRHEDIFALCRFGDDMGFKTGTLLSPQTIRTFMFPQYKRVIDLIHSRGKLFLWHSCGCIFDLMEDAIALGINAKHSNEDQIAPFDKWIDLYGSRIGLVGGIDVDVLCMKKPDEIRSIVMECGARFRARAHGYALGSGNSIPDYVPVEGYLAMIEAAQQLREKEE